MSGTSRPFVPPFCPRTACRFHHCADGWRWSRHGTFTRQCEPRVIQRYRCGHCGATFSTQTFSTTYYLKRPELQIPLLYRLQAGSGLRQMAREMRCVHATLVGQTARLGRHALLFLTAHRPRGALTEPLVADGFESFAYSQYHPLYLNLCVGAVSLFVYAFTHSPLRRKGRMTMAQKRRRERLEALHGRPDPRAIELGTAAALKIAVPQPQSFVLRTDEHAAYPRAIRHLSEHEIRHECTPSVQARTTGNPLFPVNREDLMMRHCNANHRRQTIAFSKRDQAVIERAAVHALTSNFCRPVSVNRDPRTPAMKLGLVERRLGPVAILAQRLFPSRVSLPEPWGRYYRREVNTAEIRNPRRHALKRAY